MFILKKPKNDCPAYLSDLNWYDSENEPSSEEENTSNEESTLKEKSKYEKDDPIFSADGIIYYTIRGVGDNFIAVDRKTKDEVGELRIDEDENDGTKWLGHISVKETYQRKKNRNKTNYCCFTL